MSRPVSDTFATEEWIDADLTWSPARYGQLVDQALQLKALPDDAKRTVLQGRTIYFIFFNQSLRTRSSFQTGLAKMGGHSVPLDPGSGIYTPALPGQEIPYSTERVSDVARVLSEFGDAIAIRMYGEPAGWVYGNANAVLHEFARHARIPVINMECDRFHPCQAIADVMTMRERLGSVRGRRLTISWAYSGSWHKPVAVPQSVLLAASKMGMEITLAHPPGFDLDPEVVGEARRYADETDGSIRVTEDFEDGLAGADVVYAKSWCSLQHLPPDRSQGVEEPAMTALFDAARHWRVDDRAMALAGPSAGFMHCLPADRGQEVTDSVIDGRQSLVYDQAANRLHGQNAIMAALLNPAALH
jgi:N-acetylornithine carbamoyltransferase